MSEESATPNARHERLARVAIGVVALAAAMLSMIGFHLMRRGLAFHDRDFGFFVTHYAHVWDVPAWARVPMNPNGNDVFGFEGIDGYPTVRDEVHASPIEYLLAPVYLLTRSVYALQVVFIGAYLATFAYVVRRPIPATRTPIARVIVVALLALTPATLYATTFDLRPFILLGPFVVLLAVALVSRAPGRHLAAIAALGLAAREDAAIVLALAAAYLHLDGRPVDARRLYAAVVLYVIVFFAVFTWALGFAHAWNAESLAAFALLAVYPALALVPPSLRAALARGLARHRTLAVLVVALPFFGIALRHVLNVGWPRHHFVFSARWYAPLALLAIAAADLIETRTHGRARHALAGGLAIAALLGGVGSVVQLSRWARDADEHADFWPVRTAIPADAPIVTDYDHYQAFSDHAQVLVWDRMPAYLEPSEGRDHPGDHAHLRAALVADDPLVVMRRNSFRDFTTRMQSAGIAQDWVHCVDGERWIVVRAAAGTRDCPRVPD